MGLSLQWQFLKVKKRVDLLYVIKTHLSSRFLISNHTIRGRLSFSSYVGSNTEYLSSLSDSEAILSEHYLEYSTAV